ncbi:hypothetical protein ABEB36_003458 [Hypothenemus hampei]|uniref:Fatty acid desaturase domain-containing protein n=1 Tax=Hypothenemus hampei TaxID=57062 RepID=A0ABD1F979_HYPHA
MIPQNNTVITYSISVKKLRYFRQKMEKSKEDHLSPNFQIDANPEKKNYKLEIVWRNVVIFAILHSLFLYWLYLIITFQIKFTSFVFCIFYAVLTVFGVTAGAHRLWTHKSYKANLPVRIFLMLCQSGALQNHIYEWARDHRVHHKFADTDADPHNINRGFFFAHIGWLMCKKHPDVINKGKTIDMSDLLKDPVVVFQKKHYIPLVLIFNLVLPTYFLHSILGETLWTAFVCNIGRYVFSLNGTWFVNSAAHVWGNKPYEINIKAVECFRLSWLMIGEGWHNYHHVFPWDYKAAELPIYKHNLTVCILDLMAKAGWVTDLKTVPEEIIRKRAMRTGDKSWKYSGNNVMSSVNNEDVQNDTKEHTWGWGDKDMSEYEMAAVKILNRHHE